MNSFLSKLPVFADIIGILYFTWMTSYFYRKSLRQTLTPEEKILFILVIGGLLVDTFFVLSILILPKISK
jgi:hypothetical protein